MEMNMLNLDLGWEKYGLPKTNENEELPRKYKGSGRKQSTRAKRRKATENHKNKVAKENKSLAYDENLLPKINEIGVRHIGEDVKHKKFYDSIKLEQQKKLASREIRNYPDDILTFEDKYLYPLKRNYFDKEDYYLCTDNIHAHMNNNFKAKCGTPVKEVLFNLFNHIINEK